MCVHTKKLWTTAPAPLRVIRINYSHHNGKPGQLPVHLTPFPPVSVAAMFFLCFFLRTTIHHAHFKRLAFQFCAQWSAPFTLKFVPMCLQSSSILTCSSELQIFCSPVFPGCTAAFLCSHSWKVYFCADNISCISCLLIAENWAIVFGAARTLVHLSPGLQTDKVNPFAQRCPPTNIQTHTQSEPVKKLRNRKG